MKRSELKSMIKHIVREEVALTVKEVISEILSVDKSSTTNVDHTTYDTHRNSSTDMMYSNNKVLNDILNETVPFNSEERKSDPGGFDLSGIQNTKVNSPIVEEVKYNDISDDTPQVKLANRWKSILDKSYNHRNGK